MYKQTSIKNKIVLFAVGVILLFGVAAVVFVFFSARSRFSQLRQEDVTIQVVEQARNTSKTFDRSIRTIANIATQDEIVRYLRQDPQPQDPRIVQMLAHYNSGQFYDPLYILDPSGVAIASLDPSFVGNDYSFRDYYTYAMRGESTSDFAVGVTTGVAGYYFSHPVVDSDGTILGVLVGKFPGDAIDESFADSVLIKQGHVSVVDRDGIILYTDRKERLYHAIGTLSDQDRNRIMEKRRFAQLPLTSLGYDRMFDAIRSYSGTPAAFEFVDPISKDREIVVIASIPGTGLFLVFEGGTQALAASALTVALILSAAVLLSILFAALAIYFAVGRFLAPLSKLKVAAQRISEGDFDQRAEITTGDELEEVGTQFNIMADRLKNSYAELTHAVDEKTAELSSKLTDIETKNAELSDTQRAVLNILEDARNLELQISEERNRLRGILDSMGEGLFVVDEQYHIILSNPVAEKILGMTADEIVNKNMADIIVLYKGKEKVSMVDRPMAKVFAEGKTMVAELKDDFYWETVKGRKFPVGFIAAPLIIGGMRSEVVVFRNLEREKNLDEARTSFISITSHQLRTPLTSIKWFLEMLMDGSYADPLTAKQREFADLAYQAGGKMMGIINLLLQIARIEAGRVKTVPVSTDLKQLTETIVASLGNIFQMRKQTVAITAIPDPLPVIPIDTDIVGQVIQNLLSNANRYANEDSVIAVSIATGRVEHGNEFITYSVADKGIGISKDAASRIFEKFYRAENALRAVPEGSGLGLSLVKLLVEGWGGRVWFESEESKGTTFFFTIPIKGMQPRAGEVGIRVD